MRRMGDTEELADSSTTTQKERPRCLLQCGRPFPLVLVEDGVGLKASAGVPMMSHMVAHSTRSCGRLWVMASVMTMMRNPAMISHAVAARILSCL